MFTETIFGIMIDDITLSHKNTPFEALRNTINATSAAINKLTLSLSLAICQFMDTASLSLLFRS